MLVSKDCVVSVVAPLECRKLIPRVAPSFSHVLCVCALEYPCVAFPSLEADVCLFSESCFRELIHLQQVFVRGGCPFEVNV